MQDGSVAGRRFGRASIALSAAMPRTLLARQTGPLVPPSSPRKPGDGSAREQAASCQQRFGRRRELLL